MKARTRRMTTTTTTTTKLWPWLLLGVAWLRPKSNSCWWRRFGVGLGGGAPMGVVVSAQSMEDPHPDIRATVAVSGVGNPGGLSWADSYSVGGQCYCDISSFDHGVGAMVVATPLGWKTVRDICRNVIGRGPGPAGNPIYNDIQCGNGPPNSRGDEHECPGRTDIGAAGCGQIGPKWKFPTDNDYDIPPPPPPTADNPDIMANVADLILGVENPDPRWFNSYSRGNNCYCLVDSLTSEMANFWIELPYAAGEWRQVSQICALFSRGPGIFSETPLYNDVQCGNGPPDASRNEHVCPGQVNAGAAGCGRIGPTWNWASVGFLISVNPTFAPTMPPVQRHSDITVVVQVVGVENPRGEPWSDSYSIDGKCYCDTSSLAFGVGRYIVPTPMGWKSIEDVCRRIIGSPSAKTKRDAAAADNIVLYNDIQCGHGPPNRRGDEHLCPGRVDRGRAACGHVGPTWWEDVAWAPPPPFTPSTRPPGVHADVTAILSVPGEENPRAMQWASSYSNGDECFCIMDNLNDNIRDMMVPILGGSHWMSIQQVCQLIGQSPLGRQGRPLYNDVQCGHGPPSSGAGDEHSCPGRVDMGPSGCGHVGPKWDLAALLTPTSAPSTTFPAATQVKVGRLRDGVFVTTGMVQKFAQKWDWYLLYSPRKLAKRLRKQPLANKRTARRLLAVVHNAASGKWFYDVGIKSGQNMTRRQALRPLRLLSADRIVARLVKADGSGVVKVEPLRHGVGLDGVAYTVGDLTFSMVVDAQNRRNPMQIQMEGSYLVEEKKE